MSANLTSIVSKSLTKFSPAFLRSIGVSKVAALSPIKTVHKGF